MWNQDSIISGEKLQQLCNIYCGSDYDLNRNPIISQQKQKHLNIENLNSKWDNPNLIFCYSSALDTFITKFHFLKNPFVLVSHNEDNNITDKFQSILNSPLLIKWYAQNIMIHHPKLHILPIGIANSMWQHGNVNTLINIASQKYTKSQDVYFYFNVDTNHKERDVCKVILEQKGLKFSSQKLYSNYLNELAKCKFAICPPGNGIDCHRTWECYYLNVIPIFLKSTFTEILSNYLPCILLDKWEDFDYKLLNSYDSLIHRLNNNKYLNFSFYKDIIYKYIPKSFSHQDSCKQPLDYKLNSLMNKENGIFIELGANDGLTQSNTAFFEFYKGWKGILIEPSPNAFNECKKNRPNSLCYNYACVSSDFQESEILGDFNGSLMSSIDGKRLDSNQLISVKTATLDNIIEQSKFTSIDLLSLDTEGYELNILKGLNLNKHRPKYMLIEIYDKQYAEIIEFLENNNYILMCNFTNYNKTDNPFWEGTHNDFLFFDAM
jgi:FkbM family methyltransferase